MPLPDLITQADRLIELGVAQVAGIDPAELRSAALTSEFRDALLAIEPSRITAAQLVPLLNWGGKPAFVVSDMTDVDAFTAIEQVTLPGSAAYVVDGLDRGDSFSNVSPNEALPAITAAGRTPLMLTEALYWVLQQPEVLERNHCFMTIGSRALKANGQLDPRTPAIWISNGTGRDGAAHRGAAKIGWCWAGNRHTWLGIASALDRTPIAH